MNTHGKGRIAEHLAAAALIYNDYVIYPVDYPSGETDIIAEKDGVVHKCQVKAFYLHKSYGRPTRRRRENKQLTRPGYRGYGYKEVDMRTSNAGDHRSYKDLPTDVILAVDIDTAEVFWYELTKDSPKASMNKQSIITNGRLLYPSGKEGS